MQSCKDHYFVTVIEDTETEKIIAASTLAVELKFIRNCALVSKAMLSHLLVSVFGASRECTWQSAYNVSNPVSEFVEFRN